jgi:hypothetical protein
LVLSCVRRGRGHLLAAQIRLELRFRAFAVARSVALAVSISDVALSHFLIHTSLVPEFIWAVGEGVHDSTGVTAYARATVVAPVFLMTLPD